jgi:hypothetical protein
MHWRDAIVLALTPWAMGTAIGLSAVLLPWVAVLLVAIWVSAGVLALRTTGARGRRRRMGIRLLAVSALLMLSALGGALTGINLAQGITTGWWVGVMAAIASVVVAATPPLVGRARPAPTGRLPETA